MTNLLNIKIRDILDLINTAQYLNEALHMAASDSGLTRTATDALQALSGEIDNKLHVIEDRLEEVIDDVESQGAALVAVKKVVDGDALLAAVRAEKARRQSAEEANAESEETGRRYPPDLGELETDICHLSHLVDTLCDLQFEDGNPERCNALLWIVRDQASKCKDMFEGKA